MADPQLDRRGAGLPFPENLFVRYVIMPLAARMSDDRANALFKKEGARILALVDRLSDSELTTRVLVPRILGLEDSSRYWSIAMTIEHLNIVSSAMMETIRALSSGISPPTEVDIAKVKTLGSSPLPDVFATFRELQNRGLSSLPEDSHQGKAKLSHPWFGPMTSQQWRVLTAIHERIHRR